LLAFLILIAEEQGVSPQQLRGTTQNDILKEYIARGTYIYPPAAGLRIATDLIAYTAKEVPKWNPMSISGYHIREAGSTAVEELAFTFANAITYVEDLAARGSDITQFIGQLSFFFNAHQDFFEEIAKFRAARELWANLVRDRFHIKDAQLAKLRFHTQTAGSSLTAQQPMHNLVRTAYEALSAVLGGTQSLHTNAFDEALGLPTEQSALLALRTQQILAQETEISQVADPLGGSYFIEHATDKMVRDVQELLEEVFRHGGVLRGIETGFFQDRIEASAFRYQKELETGEKKIVGVNLYAEEEGEAPPRTRINVNLEESRKKEMQAWKNARRPDWSSACEALRQAALNPSAALFPHILTCARAGATLGEISDILRGVFGEYAKPSL
jgi:methylmalonyl-CoA mutase N-terminal domain/subunit